ncbi:hypothetical protein TNCT_585071 [Trichonephila clavata]|uniref:Uncharacterized protein n=1 Tax=Trichonephila clavata TaxID=2740835 RepID=A0A8X6J189_TRICU|nr:hypothetical protein TNCT_585071 [Trichonephila clavata]
MDLNVSNESGYDSFNEDVVPVQVQLIQLLVRSRMIRRLIRFDNGYVLCILCGILVIYILIGCFVLPSHIAVLTGFVFIILLAAIYFSVKYMMLKLYSLSNARNRRIP